MVKKRVSIFAMAFITGLFFISGILVFMYFFAAENPLTLHRFKEVQGHLWSYVHQNYWRSVFMYIALYAFVQGFALPEVLVFALAGGYYFGVFPGIVYVVGASLVGGLITFGVVRFLLGRSLQERYASYLQPFNENIARYGAFYLCAVRIVPLIPFFLVNVLAALTNIPLTTFMLTLIGGLLPSSLVYVYAGQKIASITCVEDVFSKEIMILLLVVAIALATIPLVIKKIIKNNVVEKR